MVKRKEKEAGQIAVPRADYDGFVAGVSELFDQAKRATARVVNSVLTATYWEVGHRIVEFEQGGRERAGYGEELLKQLARDLIKRYGRGFSRQNLQQMRTFYLGWEICQTVSGKFEFRGRPGLNDKLQTSPATFPSRVPPDSFPLPWSHYVRLMTVPNVEARRFYEQEAIQGGWSVRQLDRQIATQFYERLRGSKRKDELLAKAHAPTPTDRMQADELVRDPYVLEFLNLTDEYGESDLEETLVRHLESFLVELGHGFTFVARQRKIRIDSQWYKIDLLMYHRRLRCLVVLDLKNGAFTHADAGQMNLYLNYVKEHLTEPGENDPVGLILCSEKSDTVVKYAMGGINAQVFASRYLTELPPAEELREEVERTKHALTAGREAESGEPE